MRQRRCLTLRRKKVLNNEKLEKYRKQLREYDPEDREWVVSLINVDVFKKPFIFWQKIWKMKNLM
jgi:hypothetical protein